MSNLLKTKRTTKKYGKLPPKEAEAIPWDKLCVDMIGPYTIKDDRKETTVQFQCVVMIDPATGWFELVKEKDAMTVANAVEMTWLTQYPWPQEIMYDRGSEFMGNFACMIVKDYGIKQRPIVVCNPQANAIIERIHQTLGNIIQTFKMHKESKEEAEHHLKGVLSAAMFALHATYHTTMQATLTQLVFGCDATLNVKFQADWDYICSR
jgi:transposase InsO family protein